MIGTYRNNKIEYSAPRVNYLKGGNWKDGFSGVGSSGGTTERYEILNPEEFKLEEGKRYSFELKNGKAQIIL